MPASSHSDILFKQAELIDGTGKPSFVGDVAVRGERIVGVGRNLTLEAGQIIDCAGLCLAPGFIDTHTHDDRALLDDPGMSFKIDQGVTSVVTGNCGISLAPYKKGVGAPPPQNLLSTKEDDFFLSMNDYLSALREKPARVNALTLVGHSTLRLCAMADFSREATDAESAEMARLLGLALEQGAKGLSLGLEYALARPATPREIEPLMLVLGRHQGVLTTHIRTESEAIIPALDEVMSLARKASVRLVLSHMKCSGKNNFGRAPEVLRFIENAALKQPIVFDAYPYTVAATVLEHEIVLRSQKTVVNQSAPHPEMEGKDLSDIAALWNCGIEEAIQKLLPAQALYHLMSEDDLCLFLKHPLGMIGTDGIPGRKPHPRLFASFPRFLGLYVREKKLIPLEEAIRKITSLPAQAFGFADRGEIKEGLRADLVLFDKNKIKDTATFETPTAAAQGIARVYVNGVLAKGETA